MNELKGLRLHNNSFEGNLDVFCDWKSNSTEETPIHIVTEVALFPYKIEAGFCLIATEEMQSSFQR